MMPLDRQKLIDIQDMLRDHYNQIDNQLYHHYSVQGLKETLEKISDAQFYIDQLLDETPDHTY